jgi:hypothetical protein
MELTKKILQEGQTVKQGNISIRLTNNAYMVQDHTGNWYGYETYKKAKEEYNSAIETAERLKLQ